MIVETGRHFSREGRIGLLKAHPAGVVVCLYLAGFLRIDL